MAYRSQLVIRTSDAEGAEVLERVKELADGESKTISEKAIELLGAALAGPRPAKSEPAQPSQAQPQTTAAAAEPAAESVERAVTVQPLQPPSVREKDPAVRPDEAPQDAATRSAMLLENHGVSAAAQALTAFFAAAEPVDGANIREELQERLSKTDYDALMDELKQTEEYREYRRRVVYASW